MKHLIKHFLSWIKEVFSNKIAIIFVVGHLAFVTLVLIDTYIKDGTLSEITGHIYGQRLLVNILTVINLPVAFLSLFISVPLVWFLNLLGGESLGVVVIYSVTLFCINFQWALIGYGIDKLFQRKVK